MTLANLSDKFISWLRTVVPAAWASLLVWVAAYVTLPESLSSYLTNPITVSLVVSLSIGAYKALFNWLEPKMPAWLTRILVGSNQTPTYGGGVDGSEPDLEDIDPETFDETAPVDGDLAGE